MKVNEIGVYIRNKNLPYKQGVTGSNPVSPTKKPSDEDGFFCFTPPAYLFMHHVYIIYSSNLDVYYIGSTSNVEERIKKHNSKHKGFTNQTNDWELVYMESFDFKTEALIRERQLKNWKSRVRIEELIKRG